MGDPLTDIPSGKDLSLQLVDYEKNGKVIKPWFLTPYVSAEILKTGEIKESVDLGIARINDVDSDPGKKTLRISATNPVVYGLGVSEISFRFTTPKSVADSLDSLNDALAFVKTSADEYAQGLDKGEMGVDKEGLAEVLKKTDSRLNDQSVVEEGEVSELHSRSGEYKAYMKAKYGDRDGWEITPSPFTSYTLSDPIELSGSGLRFAVKSSPTIGRNGGYIAPPRTCYAR